MVISKDMIINTSELMDIILADNPTYKSSSLYNKINELEKNGVITRIGKSKYIYKRMSCFSYELESHTANKVLKHMKSNYSSDFEFVIYEINVVLNQFLNHLIVGTTIVLEAPKMFLEHIFNSLKENGFKNVLINPTEEDLHRYSGENTIVLHPLISKAPIDKKEKKTTIEKLTVDIICDPLFHCFYEGAEIKNMVDEILSNYRVKYDSLKNYAKRRHAYEKLMKCVPENMMELFDD